MYDYIHDVILNITNADEITTDASKASKAKVYKYTNPKTEEDIVSFKRNGEYKLAKIKDVAKTEGVAGKPSTLTLHCDGLIKSAAVQGETVYETGLYNFSVYMKMPNRFYGEFANANWYSFGKPVIIGFEVTEEMAKDGAVLAEKLKRLFDLAVPGENRFISASVNGTDLVLELAEPYMRFGDVILEKYDPTVCDSCLGEYAEKELVKGTNYDIVDPEEPFGTAEWITENLRFPSYPRVRYKGVNSDENPMPGVIYDMISFVYESERKGLGGMDSVGQSVAASTRHVFYVPQAFSAQVESMLKGE